MPRRDRKSSATPPAVGEDVAAPTPVSRQNSEEDNSLQMQKVSEAQGGISDALNDSWTSSLFSSSLDDAVFDMTRLPEAEQTLVVESLDDEQFASLLSRVSASEVDSLEVAFNGIQDPARKLAMWEVLYRNRVSRMSSAYTKQQAEIEMEGDLARLRELVSGGAGPESVADQAERRNLEMDIERRFALNLVHDRTDSAWKLPSDGAYEQFVESRKPRDWSLEELETVMETLKSLPFDHVVRNDAFRVLFRQAGEEDGPNGRHHDKIVRLYDNGTRSAEGAEQGDKLRRTLARGVATSIIDNPSQFSHFDDFVKLSSWERVRPRHLQAALEAEGLNFFEARGFQSSMDEGRREPVEGYRQLGFAGERMFRPGEYGGYYSVYHSVIDRDRPGWVEDNASPERQFVSLYERAVSEPESMYASFITNPRQELAELQAQADPDPTALEQAKLKVSGREALHGFFRRDVFGTDDSDIQSLVAPEGKEALYDDFKQRAARTMTPRQLAGVRREFESSIP